jgi:hypothetical protein
MSLRILVWSAAGPAFGTYLDNISRGFEFRILERRAKIVAQGYRNVSHSLDTTGEAGRNPDWEFSSVDQAKESARRHLSEVLRFRCNWSGRRSRTGEINAGVAHYSTFSS